MKNFEIRKESSDILPSCTPKHEVSIELDNLEKNLDSMKEAIGKLEEKISSTLKRVSDPTPTKDEEYPPLINLVPLAARINESNAHLLICNSKIRNMADICQL